MRFKRHFTKDELIGNLFNFLWYMYKISFIDTIICTCRKPKSSLASKSFDLFELLKSGGRN